MYKWTVGEKKENEEIWKERRKKGKEDTADGIKGCIYGERKKN